MRTEFSCNPRSLTSIFATSAVLMILFTVNPVQASHLEFTDSIHSAWSKTAEQAQGTAHQQLISKYEQLQASQKEISDLEDKAAAKHYENEGHAAVVRKNISGIQGEKIRSLEDQVKSVKSRHQPLFDTYSTLSRQVTAANRLKDKSLYKVLRRQADAMKIVVGLARQEIKDKEELLKSAKSQRTDISAKVRSTLADIDPIKSKIKAEKSAASSLDKQVSTEWKNFKAAIRKSEVDRTADTLSRLCTLSSEIVKHKQSIYNFELRIEGVIKKASSQLSSG